MHAPHCRSTDDVQSEIWYSSSVQVVHCCRVLAPSQKKFAPHSAILQAETLVLQSPSVQCPAGQAVHAPCPPVAPTAEE